MNPYGSGNADITNVFTRALLSVIHLYRHRVCTPPLQVSDLTTLNTLKQISKFS